MKQVELKIINIIIHMKLLCVQYIPFLPYLSNRQVFFGRLGS